MRDGSALSVLPKSNLRASKTEARPNMTSTKAMMPSYQPCGKQPASPLPQDQVMVLPYGYESTLWFPFVINHSLSTYRQKDSLCWFVKDNFLIHFGKNLNIYLLLGFYILAKYPLPLTKIDFLIDQLKCRYFQNPINRILAEIWSMPRSQFLCLLYPHLKNSNW